MFRLTKAKIFFDECGYHERVEYEPVVITVDRESLNNYIKNIDPGYYFEYVWEEWDGEPGKHGSELVYCENLELEMVNYGILTRSSK